MLIYIWNWTEDITRLIIVAADNVSNELIFSWRANSRLSTEEIFLFNKPSFLSTYSQKPNEDILQYLLTC
jgi:hypothetical protein